MQHASGDIEIERLVICIRRPVYIEFACAEICWSSGVNIWGGSGSLCCRCWERTVLIADPGCGISELGRADDTNRATDVPK